MPKGKPWSLEEEKQLRKLVDAHKPVDVIAAALGKTEDAIQLKCRRLGLSVEEDAKGYTTSSLPLPKELPSVEEALKILAGALKAAGQAGLDKVEVQRLQVVATLARTYKELLTDYVNYRAIETKLVEMEAKYEQLLREKTKDNASKRNSAAMVPPAT